MLMQPCPPYLKEFLKTHPTVKVKVEYRRDRDVYRDVLRNAVDLAPGELSYTKSPAKHWRR